LKLVVLVFKIQIALIAHNQMFARQKNYISKSIKTNRAHHLLRNRVIIYSFRNTIYKSSCLDFFI